MPRLIILVMTQLYYVATEPNLHWRHARKKARGSGRSEKSRRHRRQKCFKAALVEIERIALGGIAYGFYFTCGLDAFFKRSFVLKFGLIKGLRLKFIFYCVGFKGKT